MPFRRTLSSVIRGFILFLLGAAGYSLLEILWRGFTHWSMFLTGGACFCGLYGIGCRFDSLPLRFRAALGCAMITAAEFLVGCVVNLWMGWNVWDYSAHPCNLLGQICPMFCLVWYLISCAVLPLFPVIRRGRCREKDPPGPLEPAAPL